MFEIDEIYNVVIKKKEKRENEQKIRRKTWNNVDSFNYNDYNFINISTEYQYQV